LVINVKEESYQHTQIYFA